jgi:hypothetical protein
MKWMRERDLLIAQTMAFVQSVTGKKPDAEKPAAPSLALEPSELESRVEAATFEAMERAIAIVEPPKAETPKAETPKAETPWAETLRSEPPNTLQIPRMNLQSDYRSEILSRVASFRAHQERVSREREAYCSATLAKIHAAIGRDGAPLRK